jgi:hypothetical protein
VRHLLKFLSAVACLALMAESPTAYGQPAASSPSDAVWRWFDRCSPEQTIHLEVFLNDKSIYAQSFPACIERRDVPESSPQQLRFSFVGRTAIFGDEYATPGTQSIQGTIWQAGGDHDALLLGVSFVAGRQILLNTIHIANPHKVSQSSLAPGLVIETSAVLSVAAKH